MPSSFFVLLRYFLRVDNVLVRINDTRLYHDFSTNYILREYTNRESEINKLRLPLPMFSDPNLLIQHLPLRISKYERISLPCSVSSSSQHSGTSVDKINNENVEDN